jgi:hypothetical protein
MLEISSLTSRMPEEIKHKKLDTIAARVTHARTAAGFKTMPALARALSEKLKVDVTPQAIQLIETGTTKRSRYLPDILSGEGPERDPQAEQPRLVYSRMADTGRGINSDALRRAMAKLDEVLAEEKISLPSELKSGMLEALYMIFDKGGQADVGLVKTLLKLVKK